ncbi:MULTISPECIES: hypothetical protein [Pseudonocardia]|uniref:Uncharacterized protein n=1 Tax=Pseudonocardia oroxyli TaxID=366584 RepID=A0A1G7ESF5_PSEOR|nr:MULTISPECIES: hypothetical protein [Pseudonocardia]MCF7548303.1 hypothetical protein [Pseudonocardia sp. WMMC193]SDE66567.1 hypothetical protein SAMN05216377_101463 [Pseudonocardia oroxyli]
MTSTVLTVIAVIALLAWIVAWTPVRRRRALHPVIGSAIPFHGYRDADRARLVAELRALPDAPADVEARLRI